MTHKIESILKEIFSHTYSPRAESYRVLPGNRHLTIEVNTSYSPMIIRLINPEVMSEESVFGTHLDVNKERHLLVMLGTIEPKIVPKIISLGKLNNGEDYLVLTKLPGKNFRMLRPEISLADAKKAMTSLGSLVGKIQKQFTFENFGELGEEKIYDNWGSYWRDIVRSKARLDLFDKVFNPKEKKEILDYTEKLAGKLPETKPALLIYDLHDNNFNVNSKMNVRGIYDFDHTCKAPGQLEILSIELSIINSEFKDGSNPEMLKQAFKEGYLASAGKEFVEDPLIKGTGWLAHMLYSSLNTYKLREKRPGFTEILKHRALQLVREGVIDTKKFFNITPDGKSSILPEYQPFVEKNKLNA
ncbi:aminoglycoside phosphotransferase family protein [Candidatus Woesearchaeota archaeon]|nr:aminoglycoside phosphotransferase family protein [Candidatus Woesearchaeota archaeon]